MICVPSSGDGRKDSPRVARLSYSRLIDRLGDRVGLSHIIRPRLMCLG